MCELPEHLCEDWDPETGKITLRLRANHQEKPRLSGTEIGARFMVRDSGARQEFAGGMVRDVTTGKVDYALVLDGPMFDRWAAHLTKGAQKYDKGNWLKAAGPEELARFRESAFRHFVDWYRGKTDEDHAAGVYFNINGAEYVKAKGGE